MPLEWLICRDPVHIGGADSSTRGNNNPIFRLPDRTPAIPGSSLRGALREHASINYPDRVETWFGGQVETAAEDNPNPGAISIGWGWPVWWPVHVLGYGNWWISCPKWLHRVQQFNQQPPFAISDGIKITNQKLKKEKTLFLRWLKLNNVSYEDPSKFPVPDLIDRQRLIIVPDESINLITDMGLVRQPRIKLKEDDNPKLFAIEGLPPGAVFIISWTRRNTQQPDRFSNTEWSNFLRGEHQLGGLWGIGYGRVEIVNPNAGDTQHESQG